MKKTLSVLLAVLMLLGGVTPAVASAASVARPVVFVGGQEDYIYSDKNDATSETYFTGDLPEDALNTVQSGLYGALFKGLSNGKWTEYCDGFYAAAMPYYENIMLSNGSPTNNTGYDCLKESKVRNKAKNGKYDLFAYKFIYDWRLDPVANAAELNDYIGKVLTATKFKTVNIVAEGIGCSTVLAYLKAYGSGKVSELVLDNAALNGSEVYGAYFSGNIKQNADDLAVFVAEARRNIALLQVIKSYVDPESWNNYMSVKATRTVYGKLYEDAIPRIARTVYATMPGYWSLIGDDDFDDALATVFADAKFKKQNATLIKQIKNYHNTVAVNTESILNAAVESGVKVYNIVNYGFILVPVSDESGVTSDVYISAASGSLGATAAPYGETLSAAYIKAAKKNKTSAYISPDGELDASTGILRDHTWYVKNLENREKPACVDELIGAILGFEGYTGVNDLAAYPQFLYCSNDRLDLSPLSETGGSTYQDTANESSEATRFSISGFGETITNLTKMIMDLVVYIIGFIRGEIADEAAAQAAAAEQP